MLCGKNVMSWQVLFASKNTKGNWGRYGFYGTLPEAFLVSGNYRIRRKQIFVSYDSMETNFCFLLGNEFLFLGNEFLFPPRKRIFVSRKRNFVSGVLYRLVLSHYEIFSSTSRPLVGIVAGTARFDYQR